MSVTGDIVETYLRPRRVMARLLAGGAQEGRALAVLLLACALIVVAQLPRLSREAALAPENGLTERASGELLVWMFFVPLGFYGLAALAHLLARLWGGRGTWAGARIASFWPLLATAPLWLFRGLLSGLSGPGPALDLVTLLALAIWLLLWGICLHEAERRLAGEDEVA